MIQTSRGVWMKYTGSATNSNWPGTPPGQQRDCALKARWPLRTRSLCILIRAAAHGFRLGFSASDKRSRTGWPSAPRPRGRGSAPTGATFPAIGSKSRKVVGCHPKLADMKFGMVLSSAPAPTLAAIEASSTAPHSEATLNIARSSVVELRSPLVGVLAPWLPGHTRIITAPVPRVWLAPVVANHACLTGSPPRIHALLAATGRLPGPRFWIAWALERAAAPVRNFS